jgi:HAD superfamily hydrolase (TIGR01549 family)
MKPVRGVILDVDGTLVESNDGHAQAWVQALAEQGIHVPFDKVRALIGMGGDRLLPRVSGIRESSPEGKEISQRRRQIFELRELPSLRPTPGAKELLQRLHADGLKLAVASSAKEDELKGLLKVAGADQLIETKTSSDDADHSKPAPDIVQAARARLGLSADEVVMLGDTPYDVESARRAGVPLIAVRCGGWGDRDLAGAVAVYDNPADLLAHYDASPLARGRG